MIDLSLTTEHFAQLLGKPVQTIQTWDRVGFLRPSIQKAKGRGSVKRYSFTDLVAAAIALDWQRKGVDLRAVQLLVRDIQRHGLENLGELPYVVVSGSKVWRAREGAVFLTGPAAQAFVCDLRPGTRLLKERVLAQWNQQQNAKKRISAKAVRAPRRQERQATEEVLA